MSIGLLPDQFWALTFFEFHSYSKSIEFQDELAWRRESQGLSLLYNINKGKGRSLGPEDFNPYEMMKKTKEAPKVTAEEIQELRDKLGAKLK